MFKRLLRETGGATSIEYALIAVIVSIVIVSGLTVIGTKLNASFTSASSGLK